MSSLIVKATQVPKVNDLVEVVFGLLDDGHRDGLTSRVEDLLADPKTGHVREYVIAAPFVSALAVPDDGAALFLQWITPRGVGLLPGSFAGEETTKRGLRQWRVTVTGAPLREERRRFVRVPYATPMQLHVHRDLTALDAHRRRMAARTGVLTASQALPDIITGLTIDLSEGSVRCVSTAHVLPIHLPVTCHFTVATQAFAFDSVVVRCDAERSRGQTVVRSAINFLEPGKQADTLRKMLFREQLQARRSQLDAAETPLAESER
jgi:hypothetical protein